MIKRFKKEINILKIAELDHWMVTNLKKYNKISILTVVLAHKDMNLEIGGEIGLLRNRTGRNRTTF